VTTPLILAFVWTTPDWPWFFLGAIAGMVTSAILPRKGG
jgi:hypothetical protein